MKLSHKFTKYIPDTIEENILYISVEYGVIVHKCCCGCGEKVVTPLTPTDWKMIFDGKTISLYPSIGNWSFACQSHYWIKNNEVNFASKWSKEQIKRGREEDFLQKKEYYKNKRKKGFLTSFKNLFSKFKR